MSMRLPKQVGEWISRDKKSPLPLKVRNMMVMKATRLPVRF